MNRRLPPSVARGTALAGSRTSVGALLLGLAACMAGCAGAGTAPVSAPVSSTPRGAEEVDDPGALQLAREVWSALDRTTNTCSGYDYFPRGGVRIFACHLFSLVSFERIVAQSGLRPFDSGPHGAGLNLRAADDFGHYNVDFVRFLARHAVPASRDSAFRAATQAHYDTYVAPLANIMYATHQKLARSPACFTAEREEYQAAIARGATDGYVEPWFFFMNDAYCEHRRGDYSDYGRNGFDGGYAGNVVKTSVGFWLRRSMDGTERVFFDALLTLMDTYEPVPGGRSRLPLGR